MAAGKNRGGYEIGYGRPPKHTRFKPGQSGNRYGRPKKTRNLKTDLAEELTERIVISEGGRQRAISKQRAMLKQLMAKALRGDVRAANTVLSLVDRLVDTRTEVIDETLAAERQAILDAYVARQTAAKHSCAASPVIAPPELLDDDASDEADAK